MPGEFAERVVEAFHGRPDDTFSLALSGGETARACYERLAADAGTQIDWWKVDVYWGDERCVPARPPRLELPPGPRGTARSGRGRQRHLPDALRRGSDPYQLRIGELGRSTSSTSASAPTATPPRCSPTRPPSTPTRAAGGAQRGPERPQPPQRMTLTFAGIARARLVVVTVVGEDKAEALAAIARARTCPAAASAPSECCGWSTRAAAPVMIAESPMTRSAERLRR